MTISTILFDFGGVLVEPFTPTQMYSTLQKS
jgi:hypothetical protein